MTYRTHTCNALSEADTGKEVTLSGWIHNRRDLGGVTFIDLRDHYGITQLVIRDEIDDKDTFLRLPKETVVKVQGEVILRDDFNINPELDTGKVELSVKSFEILNHCAKLPFSIFPDNDMPEELRLKHRYLDLRKEKMHNKIVLRSKIISSIRKRMENLGFLEYQTPILTSSSPEGARDYLVPSRVHPGKFYALPQAPQQFKQLLMVSGFDRYFQIAPCFRDEDARADRSPGEFYQLDLEMSFVTQDEVFAVVENLLCGIFEEFKPDDMKFTPAPFERIPYHESMIKYGSDKPDLRNPLVIQDISELFAGADFRAFADKTVRCLKLPNGQDNSRAFFDKTEDFAKSRGAFGLAWVIVKEDGSFKGPIAKFLSDKQTQDIKDITGAVAGDAIFFSADTNADFVAKILGEVRNYLGQKLDLLEKGIYRFCWIVDYPMYEYDEENKKVEFSHNPFSMPQGGLDALNTMDPLDIKAWQYDIVCNGYELSSGAIRNHNPEIMYKAFEIAGYGQDEVENKFAGMINALKYGAPPHGGIAPGIDRIVMLLLGEQNIREIIAFPLNQSAQDLMMNAPNNVSQKQLEELHIQLDLPEEDD